MKKFLIILLAAMMAVPCSARKFPRVGNNGRIGIVAHQGFWQSEASGERNSLSSLDMAFREGFIGSEFDVNLTKDGEVLVSHGPNVGNYIIADTDFETLAGCLLERGSRRPSLGEYLALAKKDGKGTVLVLEIKAQNTPELEDELISKCVGLLKENGLFKPSRVMFISFSLHVCEQIAALYPKFINQYLSGGMSPAELAAKGINGLDYHFSEFFSHPEWVEEAHNLGMSVNIWTVDGEEDLLKSINLGVDQITTNRPLVLRDMLGSTEWQR